MPARREVTDVDASGNQARQQLVGFTQSASPDSVLGFIGNNNGRVSLQIKSAAFNR